MFRKYKSMVNFVLLIKIRKKRLEKIEPDIIRATIKVSSDLLLKVSRLFFLVFKNDGSIKN